MPRINSIRAAVQEGAYTFIGRNIASVLSEIDSRFTGRDMFVKFIRVGGYISRTEFYRNTDSSLAVKREYSRVSGVGGIEFVDTVVTTFYENDGVTVDSIVSGFLTRDLGVSGDDLITCCSGVFNTTEETKI